MATYRRYRIQQKYVDGVPTEEYRLGGYYDEKLYPSLERCEKDSPCTDIEYRWIDVEDEFRCEGTVKYALQKRQQRCVGTDEWVDIYPYEYQRGEIIERNSTDCGYDPAFVLYYSYIMGIESEYQHSSTILYSGNYNGSAATIIRNTGGMISAIGSHSVHSYTNVHPTTYYVTYNAGFALNSNLVEVDFPGLLLTSSSMQIGKQTLYFDYHEVFARCSNLTTVKLANIEVIPLSAFRECEKLKDVYIPKATLLDAYCFCACGISSIDLPNVSYISVGAFNHCSNLKNISIPKVEVIQHDAFCNCVALESFSTTASYVGYMAFHYCENLKDVYLHSTSMVTLSLLGDFHNASWFDPFYSCSPNMKIHVPNSLYNDYISEYGERYFNEVIPYRDVFVGDL